MQRISGWHNISTNVPYIDIDKVTFEDLVSILNNIKNKKIVKDLVGLEEEIQKHVVDLLNPHHLTMEQLPYQVIDVFYEAWLSQGYYGTKDQFIDTIFNYVYLSSWEDMLEGLDPEIVPTVKHFYDYLQRHNTSVEDTHVELLDTIFKDNPGHIYPPSLTYTSSAVPLTVQKCYNEKTKYYENVPLSALAFPYQATVILHGKYQSGTWFHIRNEKTSTKFFSIIVDAENNKVKFKSSARSTTKVDMELDITSILQEVKDKADKITIVAIFDGNKVKGMAQLYGSYMYIPIESTIVEIDGKVYRYPKKSRQTYNTLLTLPEMSRTSYLEEIVIYPCVLNEKAFSFVFNIFD